MAAVSCNNVVPWVEVSHVRNFATVWQALRSLFFSRGGLRLFVRRTHDANLTMLPALAVAGTMPNQSTASASVASSR
jgi:hypothetical protein